LNQRPGRCLSTQGKKNNGRGAPSNCMKPFPVFVAPLHALLVDLGATLAIELYPPDAPEMEPARVCPSMGKP
jgi:hypothetical protein